MELKVKISEEKLIGSYYTPEYLSDFIAGWLGDKTYTNGLEPSCGDGQFIKSLQNKNVQIDRFKGIELIYDECLKAQSKITKKGFEVINGDFWKLYVEGLKNEKFDLIVGNPPYIRYQYLTNEQREEHTQILLENKMKPNKLINAWVSFLVACVDVLDNNGKIGMVIPAELLQVAYAKDLRMFLTNSLSEITIISFKDLVFPGIQQEVVLLLGEKNHNILGKDKGKIRFIETQNGETLLEDYLNADIEFNHLDHNQEKWTKYYLNAQEIEETKKIKEDKRFLKFKDVAKIQVGITTGNNNYFSVNKEVVEEFELQDVVRPLIGRSAHIDRLYFDDKVWQKNIQKGVKAYLIDFPNEIINTKHKKYISLGEENEENLGYKCRIRERWYQVPSIWAPDAFLLRRSSQYPKFIENRNNAVSTDTMHRVKFHNIEEKDKHIAGYYNSISLAFTELEARSYGGGVLEILPGEASNVIIADLRNVDNSIILEINNKINNMMIEEKSIEEILDYTDLVILTEILNIDEEKIKIFRKIWKKLQTRRMKRKSKKK